MAKRSFGKDIKNQFFRGVVSEFSELNFPEDAAVDASNVIFSQTDGLSRRLGLDYENDYEFYTVFRSTSEPAVQEYIWENVAGNGTLSFAVIQNGIILSFYQITDSGALSTNRKAFTINLLSYGPSRRPSGLGQHVCQFTQGLGQLFISHPMCDPLRVKYTGTANGTGSIEVNRINIQIRDLEGVEDNMRTGFRPKKNTKVDQMTAEHRYNLFNQGWYGDIKCQDHPGRIQALDAWRLKRDDFPSNADVWWFAKNSNDNFDHNKIDKILKGGEAPKGHIILDAFFQNRSAEVNLTKGLPIVNSGDWRPSCIAFFAGRVFYAGVAHPEYHDKVYYTEIIRKDASYKRCFQRQDPTDENSAGLQPDDGGVITLPDVGKVVKMQPVQGFLLIFATNGIWAISGGESVDFRATDYSVQKISDVQTLSSLSFVLPKTGFPVWWNADGIYSLQLVPSGDPQRQGINVQSLTDDTIRSLYKDIPANAKKFAKGAYNPLENIIQWVYWSEDPTSGDRTELYHYDKVLVLDLDTNAFYFWDIPLSEDYPYVCGVIATRGSGVELTETTITDSSGNEITDASLDDVTVLEESIVPLSSSFRYTTIQTTDTTNYWKVTFSQFRQSEYLDWLTYTVDGVDYDSYAITGYVIRGDAQRPFQSPIVYVYSKAVEDSSAYMQGLWDYSSDDASGRETSAHQVYIDRSFFGVQRRKLRLRGRGYVLSLKFFSQTGKPFNIIGWSSFQSANEIP